MKRIHMPVNSVVRHVENPKDVRIVIRLGQVSPQWRVTVKRWQHQKGPLYHVETHIHRMMLQVLIDGVWHDPFQHEREAWFDKFPERDNRTKAVRRRCRRGYTPNG